MEANFTTTHTDAHTHTHKHTYSFTYCRANTDTVSPEKQFWFSHTSHSHTLQILINLSKGKERIRTSYVSTVHVVQCSDLCTCIYIIYVKCMRIYSYIAVNQCFKSLYENWTPVLHWMAINSDLCDLCVCVLFLN